MLTNFLKGDTVYFIWNNEITFRMQITFSFLPRGCVLMGPYYLSRKLQMEHHQGVTTQSIFLIPLVWHLSFFSLHGCQQAFSFTEFPQNTPGALGFCFLFLQIGFICIGSKCDKKQTNNYPHGPDAAPVVTQMKKA